MIPLSFWVAKTETSRKFYYILLRLCSNLEDVRKIFAKHNPTHVIHLAAMVGGLFKNMRNRLKFFLDNMRMNENVLACCHEFKVSILIICLGNRWRSVFPAYQLVSFRIKQLILLTKQWFTMVHHTLLMKDTPTQKECLMD